MDPLNASVYSTKSGFNGGASGFNDYDRSFMSEFAMGGAGGGFTDANGSPTKVNPMQKWMNAGYYTSPYAKKSG